MGFAHKIERLIPDITSTVKRFPLSVLLAVGLCLYLNIWQIGPNHFMDWSVILAFVAAFFATGAGHLVAEGRGSRNPIWAIIFGLIFGTLIYFEKQAEVSSLLFFGGMVPLLMLSPFIRRDAKQGSVWLFNLRLALAVLLALIVGLVFALGLSAVLAGLDFLLGVTVQTDVYVRFWVLATTIVGPFYGLSLLPQNLDEEIDLTSHQGSLMERGVSVLVNYILVPLTFVYALMLHAYAVKIIAIGELPKGQIATIVSLFAFGGTVTWLVGWPWRETGTKLLRFFMRGWFWLLPVPAILLSVAIWQRVAEYGVTPDRYGIALVAVWTALVFIYLVLRRNRADMRMILGSAAALLLLASFGPQGAFGTTGSSQVARIKAALESKGILKDGKILTPTSFTESKFAEDIRSRMYVLKEAGQLEKMRPWFGDAELPKTDDYYLQSKMSDLMLGTVADSVDRNFRFYARKPIDRQWSGKSRIIGPLDVTGAGVKTELPNGNSAALAEHEMKFKIDGKDEVISFKNLIIALDAKNRTNDYSNKLGVVTVSDRLTMLVREASGNSDGEGLVSSISFWLVLHD